MPFRIKNLQNFVINVLGIGFKPQERKDILNLVPTNVIKASIINGELYNKIMGRMIALTAPLEDLFYIGLTEEEFARLVYAGFLQGLLGKDDLKPPFKFDNDGYLQTAGSVDVSGSFSFDGYNNLQTIINNDVSTTSKYFAEELADITNAIDGYYNYYVDMFDYKYAGLYMILGANTTAKIYSSGQFNIPPASATYVDATYSLFSYYVLPESETHMLAIDTVFPFRWIKLEIWVNGGLPNSHNLFCQQIA